jgi:hypothetical protein
MGIHVTASLRLRVTLQPALGALGFKDDTPNDRLALPVNDCLRVGELSGRVTRTESPNAGHRESAIPASRVGG